MRDGQLLEKAEIDKIRQIPATIIQGRYDSVCPAKTAWDLHKGVPHCFRAFTLLIIHPVWPEAKFIVVDDAGHSAKEAGTQTALLDATDEYADL